MKLFQILRTSKIIRKIILRILIVETLALCSISGVCWLVLWPKLEKNSIHNTRLIQKEIISSIENYISPLINASVFILNSTTLKEALSAYEDRPSEKNYNQIQITLHELCSNMSNIRSVILVSGDDTTFNSIVNIKEADQAYVNKTSDEYSSNDGSFFKFSNIYTLGTIPETYSLCYTQNTTIHHKDYSFYFFYKVNSIITTTDSLSSHDFDSYLFASVDSSVLYSSDAAFRNTDLNGMLALTNAYYHTNNGYYFISMIQDLNWYLVSYTSNTNMYTQIFDIFNLTLLFFIFFFLLTILLLPLIISRILEPVNKLNSIMNQVSSENIDVYSDIQTNDEIGDLSNIFNQMMQRIKDYTNAKIEFETSVNKMNYNLLLAQIDLHFIGNTMSIINSLARKQQTEDIIRVNSALIYILQDCLRIKSYKITDTIEHELDILNQYMIIEQMRYDNHAQLIINVPSELMGEEIPKNILQPIVENSFRHGLYNEETGEIIGTVSLTIRQKDDSLHITIADDGHGATEYVLSLLNAPEEYEDLSRERGKHIGLSNIYQRLYRLYGSKSSIEFFSEEGFSVHIVIPVSSVELTHRH